MDDLSLSTMVDPAEAPETDEPIGTDPVTEGEPEPEGQDPEPEGDPDGTAPDRPAPASQTDAQSRDVTKLLRELRQDEARAPLAKALQDSYFRAQEYQRLFDNIETARTYKMQVEAMGGVEGLNELQELADGAQEMDRLFDEGDPRILDEMSRESPEGFKRLIPHAIDRLATVDPSGYQKIVSVHAGRLITNSVIPDYIDEAAEALNSAASDPNAPEGTRAAIRAFNRVVNVLSSLIEASKTSVPEAVPAAAGAPAPNQGREDSMRMQAAPKVAAHLNSGVANALKRFPVGTLSQDAQNDLANGVVAEIDRLLNADKSYTRARDLIYRRGDPERFVNFMKSNLDSVIDRATKAVYERRYGVVKTRTAAAAAARPALQQASQAARPAAPAGGARFVPKAPSLDQIDVDRDPGGSLFIRGRAYLKTGELVSWRK